MYIKLIIISALLSTFALLLLQKWGAIEWMQVHAPNEFLHKLFNCNFCMSFWMNVVISAIIVIVLGAEMQSVFNYLLIPVCATPLTRKLL